MDKRSEIEQVIFSAIQDFLRTTRGANMFGAGADVRSTKIGNIVVKAADGDVIDITTIIY